MWKQSIHSLGSSQIWYRRMARPNPSSLLLLPAATALPVATDDAVQHFVLVQKKLLGRFLSRNLALFLERFPRWTELFVPV